MFTLTIGLTTGKQVAKIIDAAMKERRKKTGKNVSRVDFFEAANISKNMFHRYARGEKPGADGIAKIAVGLKRWGFEVNICQEK